MIVGLTKSEGRRLGRADRRLHGQFTSLSWWRERSRPSSRAIHESGALSPRTTLAVGFSLPRHLGTAPQRSRLRRQLRVAVRGSVSAGMSCGVAIIHGHNLAVGANTQTLQEEIEHLFATLEPTDVCGHGV